MKRFLFLVILFILNSKSYAQHPWARPYFEAGIIAGVSSYSGELVNTIVDVKHIHMAFGVFGRYNLNKYLTFRLQGVYGSISGNDKDSKDISKQARNLHFRSHLLEFSAIGEFNLIGYNPVGHGKMFSPYAFLGFSIFNYNPQAKHFDPKYDGGTWVDLQPVYTEGQGLSQFPNRKPYSLTNVSIPMGLGIKYAINSNINLGFEIGIRTTFTDYLDDVSNLSYAVEEQNNVTVSLYDQTPYDDGSYTLGTFVQDANGVTVFNAERSLSFQELMADGTYLYVMNEDKQIDKDKYEDAKRDRNGDNRGANGADLYLIAGLTISYNFTDEGLSRQGFRQRRKRKGGCKSAQF